MPLLTIRDLLEGDIAEVEECLIKASDISNLYEQYLAGDGGDSHTRSPGIHASEISGCSRRLVYSIMGEKRVERSAPVWKKRFKIGHAIHAMLQKDFKYLSRSTGFVLEFNDEIKVDPRLQPLAQKWDIHSHCDGIFTVRQYINGPELIRIGLEIKSESPDGFEKLTKPKPEHVEQAHVYMACLDLPLMWFLYWNKGNQNYTPTTDQRFLIKFDPKIWAKLEQRFEVAHQFAALNQLPDREEGTLCEFCAFSHVCNPMHLQKISKGHVHNLKFSTKKP